MHHRKKEWHHTSKRRLSPKLVRLHRTHRLKEDAVSHLRHLVVEHKLTSLQLDRILNAPWSKTTLQRHVLDLKAGRTNFEKFMELVDGIYERAVPETAKQRVLHAPRGRFYARAIEVAIKNNAPTSFVHGMGIMVAKQRGLTGICSLLSRIRWQTHEATHEWYEAKRSGNSEATKKARQRIRALRNSAAHIMREL